MTATQPPSAVKVLVVCTGNICRSPAAHLLLQHALGPDAGVEVASAGVMPLVAEPVSSPMAALLGAAGVSADGFQARPLSAADVKEATLVLGVTRAHRGRAASLWPAAIRRSYTLREFARLVRLVPEDAVAAAAGSDAPAARLAALATLAGRFRSPAPAEDDDIVDPYQEEDAVYAAVFGQIQESVDTIVRVAIRR